jgi:3-oxoacyl-[acyl-carrier-protein] synthase II
MPLKYEYLNMNSKHGVNPMNKRVVITGVGVITPIGIGKKDFWDSLASGRSGIRKITRFDVSSYPSQTAGEVDNFDPTDYMDPKTARRMDRFSQFAVASAKIALEDAQFEINDKNCREIGIVIGSAIGGLPLAEDQHSIFLEKGLRRISPYLAICLFTGAASSQISIALGIKGFSNTLGGACATGTDVIGHAFHNLRHGISRIIFAGAAEAPLSPFTYGAFSVMNVLSTLNGDPRKSSKPFDRERNGFVLSEGAAVLILEELNHALDRGAHIYAEILGYGTTFDSFNMAQPSPDGIEGANAVKFALKDAEIRPEEIDYINAHGSATPLNDRTETKIIKEVFGEHAYTIPVSSNKSMTGHPLGAAGAIEAAASILTLEHQFLPPTINLQNPDPECDLDYIPNVGREAEVNIVLSSSYGFGGKNSAILLKRFNGNGGPT